MITLPPKDPALGAALDVVLSGSAMREVLGRYLPDCASGALRVESCRPYHVLYKQGRNCRVQYELTLGDTEAGSTVQTLAHVKMYGDGRTEKLWSDPALGRLVERAARLHPDPPVGRAAYVPEIRAIVQLYPVDVRLPALACAASSSEMLRALRKALPEGSALRECQAELVQYKPTHRVVLRYRLSGAEVDTIYGKLHRDNRGAVFFEVGRALAAAGVATPTPLAYLPDLRMQVHAEAPGTQLSKLRNSAEFEAWLGPVAETLARLHATQVADLLTFSPHDRADAVVAAGRTIGTALPGLAAEAEQLARSLAADLGAVVGAEATIHGDFSDNQVFVSDAGIALLDFDVVRLGNPLVDVGNFLAKLSSHREDLFGDADSMRAIFLEAYAALRPEAREHALLFEAATLLRRSALYPLKQLRPGWSDEIERLVRLAAQRLEEYRRRGRS